MKLRVFPSDSIVHRVNELVQQAKDRNQLMTGIDLTADEYAQLKQELEFGEYDLCVVVPPNNLPIFVDGESMVERGAQRMSLLLGDEGRAN